MLPKTGIRQIYTATGALGGVQTEDMFHVQPVNE